MPLTNPITSRPTYIEYLTEIGEKPTNKLERSFACGLPAVWLYLKSIGLEDLFFDLLAQSKKRPEAYKELFYLMILTNGQNQFFPNIPKDFLKDMIPADVKAAQVEIDKPDFEMTFSFTAAQLKETLEAVAKPNVMVRLGNQRKTIGIMFSDNMYHVYHADNPNALQFKTIDRCVDLIMRVINENA